MLVSKEEHLSFALVGMQQQHQLLPCLQNSLTVNFITRTVGRPERSLSDASLWKGFLPLPLHLQGSVASPKTHEHSNYGVTWALYADPMQTLCNPSKSSNMFKPTSAEPAPRMRWILTHHEERHRKTFSSRTWMSNKRYEGQGNVNTGPQEATASQKQGPKALAWHWIEHWKLLRKQNLCSCWRLLST